MLLILLGLVLFAIFIVCTMFLYMDITSEHYSSTNTICIILIIMFICIYSEIAIISKIGG